jgi:hypothetical protein
METLMATTIHEHIYARGDVSFVNFPFLPSWFATVGYQFFFFCQN